MKFRIILSIIASCIAVTLYGQQSFCSDSSIRIRYIFDNNGATLFDAPDTLGTNTFSGELSQGIPTGIALLKTTWGDSILWARKVLMSGTSRNSSNFPDGSLLCTGFFGNPATSELLLCKVSSIGIVLWAKRFRLSTSHLYYSGTSSNSLKNILIANNAIYFTAEFYYDNQSYHAHSIIAKLDLDGNIIWSKSLGMKLPNIAGFGSIPVFTSNTVAILGQAFNNLTPGPGSEEYATLTKLNDLDGSLIESVAYKIVADTLIKGISPAFIKLNADNSMALTGFINIEVLPGTGLYSPSNIVFNTLLDANSVPIHNYFCKNSVPLDGQDFYFDFNNQQQHAILSQDTWNPRNKYFITFGRNDDIQRSRKFFSLTVDPSVYRTSVNFDDRQNLHFINHYHQAGKLVAEYARISNFAPTGTIGCFGKDTSILTRYSFTLIKEPFAWDSVFTNLISGFDIPFTEDTAFVTKQLVCKIVSLCDSVHINGPASACIGQSVRYTVSKNSGCFKNLDWIIDTVVANIINTEGDSAITISFKQPFAGYIHAAISDCVVKDSFYVTVVPSPAVHLTSTDSLLCPGKTILLNATSGFAPYLWQDGTTGSAYTVSLPGLYKVTGTSYCTIQSSDSLLIKYSDTSFSINPSQNICLYDTAYIVLPNDLNNITWQPSINAYLNNKILVAYPTQNTVYNIWAERKQGCTITATSMVVLKNCPELVFFPNSFTPNNDGLNDKFKATPVRPLQFYHMTIYNRYGQIIFETNNAGNGWDGTFKGIPQPIGGYMYQCNYQFTGGIQKIVTGYFVLLR